MVDQVPAAGAITRRDRTAFRTAAPSPSTMDGQTHLVPLGEGWAAWRWVCLRSAGFPYALHEALASPALAAAADAAHAAPGDTELAAVYDAEFARAERELARSLYVAATDPRFREAIAWQNRSALRTGVDSLVRRDPATVVRTSRHRRNEALVASYLQRYCAKNDTIGFYGPVGWAEIRDGVDVIDLRPAPGGSLAARTVYFEVWSVGAIAAGYSEGLEPWLVPRRMPFVDLTPDGAGLLVPFAPPVPVDPVEARAFRFVDGARTARDVAAAVLAEPAPVATSVDEVYAALHRLRDGRRIAWSFDVALDDIHPERSVRRRLATVPDPARTAPALAALDELEAARATVAEASTMDSDAVATAIEALNNTFTRLTGNAPTRRGGQLYAGRTLVFEECLRVDDLTFGPGLLASLAEPLELVLTAARWYTAAGAALFHRACLGVYRERVRESGDPVVPLAEFWLAANDLIFDISENQVEPLVHALQERWAGLLELPAGERHVQLASAPLRERVRQAFAVAQPGWTAAVQHSPDLMIAARDADAIAAGDFTWVLGELHTGVNTLRYSTWVAYHEAPERMRAAMVSDIGAPAVAYAPTGEKGGTPSRAANALTAPHDVQLIFGHDSNGYDPRRALFIGQCDLLEVDGRLVVRRRSDGATHDLVEVLADSLSFGLSQHFHIVPSGAHTPRVSIDRLIVQRESWRFPAHTLAFGEITDERARFRAVRGWASGHGLPRHVFVRATGEEKPIYVDLASLSSVDLLARAVRLAVRNAGEAGRLLVSEMVPTPEQLWLADAEGRRYTSELRICTTDLEVTRRRPS